MNRTIFSHRTVKNWEDHCLFFVDGTWCNLLIPINGRIGHETVLLTWSLTKFLRFDKIT
ncbi:Uncharacterised protein [Streptococcus pneumoniae]|nr:Uncharacterised protein [Streptococcus pneumoniae]